MCVVVETDFSEVLAPLFQLPPEPPLLIPLPLTTKPLLPIVPLKIKKLDEAGIIPNTFETKPPPKSLR